MAAENKDTGLTWLEDAAPEPGRRRSREPRRELLIGLLLLLGILGWTVGDAWRTQHLLANYQVGVRAAAQHDWEGAHAAYLAAEDYRDAAQRAAEAATNISRRDAFYTAGAREAARADWLAALRDLREVETIQPGFRASARLRADAEQQVYTAALGDSIVQRPAADPPGLYLYRMGRWTWLKDSDVTSTVRGSGSGCYAVYDVPPSAAAQTGGVDSSAAGDGGAPGRRLMVARQEGTTLRFQPLLLAPEDFNSFSCGDQGVVGVRYGETAVLANDPRLALVANSFSDAVLHFQPYAGVVTATIHLPGPAWTVLDRSRADDVLVLGDYTGNNRDSPHTDLYLADLAGTRRLIAARAAVVQRAVLSPDQRFVLADELSGSLGGARYEHRLVLLTVDGTRPPVILRRTTEDVAPATGWFWAWFIRSGVYAGQALIGGPPLWDRTLGLLDPNHPDPVRSVATLETNEQLALLDPLAAGLLLGWRTVSPTATMRFAYLDGTGQMRPLDLRLALSEGPWQATQVGDNLIYVGSPDDTMAGQALHACICRLSLVGSGAPVPLYEYSLLQGDQDGPAVSWTLGPGALAVVNKGELRALSYDGQVDLMLERDVGLVYSPAYP
jgi:hypothetical protein